MQEIIINECYGGFRLSKKALDRLSDLGLRLVSIEIPRSHPRLIQLFDELGSEEISASGVSKLAKVTIPDGVKWHIHEYDGWEIVHENHRSWSSKKEFEHGWC